jgi:predicted DNA-binding transcriptional regulator AlpA
MVEPTKYLNEDAVAELLSVSVRTIQRWRCTGDGPPFVRAGARRVIYNPASVAEWASNRTFAHHAAEHSVAQQSTAPA